MDENIQMLGKLMLNGLVIGLKNLAHADEPSRAKNQQIFMCVFQTN